MEEGSGFFWKYCKRVSENTVIRLRSGDIITGLRTLWNKQEDFLIYSDDSIAGNECRMAPKRETAVLRVYNCREKYGIQICRKVCYNKTHSRFRKTVNGTENIRMSVSVYFTFN